MVRAKEYNEEEALRGAMEVFWEKGYHQTSMDDLVTATGANRYGFYSTFGSKHELFKRALQEFVKVGKEEVQCDLIKDDATVEDIHKYFHKVVDYFDELPLGCMICNTAIELAPHDEEIAAIVKEIFASITKTYERVLKNSQEQGMLNKDLDVKKTANYLVGQMQSLSMMGRMKASKKQMKDFLSVALKVIE